ncbi:serine/threonine-protein kinase [Polyangium sp. 15x6]|uniref:serine/threonine-protein kinase n=1 Tax=Polyangium sp. 15x6 TaxID=3042687 RepID=UPI00249B69BF|nr:serine/threonine-protein kinase [Polyangium sp. 15x6]MDI3290578.1 serine/threonine-protein kinase [Polyangium sp. 15x6]
MGGKNDKTTQPHGKAREIGRSGELRAGTVLGDHVIEELASSGGHGSVYRARHRIQGGRVAIKVMHPALMALPRMAERFVREVEVILRVHHPNIVKVHELGTLPDATPYYVMEYLEGTTLRNYLGARGRIAPEEALAILEPVCAALAVAHEAGIVHRDVKASNIMICEGPPRVVKLLDFGIAKLLAPEPGRAGLTSMGQQLGTPSIMAPEQILCGPIDVRTDIYALGALLHVLLTGRPPFESNAHEGLVEQHLAAPPPRPSLRAPVSPALDAIVLRCLEKKPDRRFESVGAFLEALREAVRAGRSEETARAEAERRAVGIHVDLRFPEGADEADESLVTALAQTLERAEDCMRSGGFLLATVTSTQLLGVKLLSADPVHAKTERRSAVQFALTLHAALQQDEGSAVHANVAVHVDAVNVRLASELDIASGNLARTETWTPRGNVDALAATDAAIEGLSGSAGGFFLEPGPPGLTIIRRASTRRSKPSLTMVSGQGRPGA